MGIEVEFIPLTMQTLFAQVIDFPALLAAGPRVAARDWTPFGGITVHCTAAGAAPEEVNVRFRETVLPAEAVADDKDRLVWAINAPV